MKRLFSFILLAACGTSLATPAHEKSAFFSEREENVAFFKFLVCAVPGFIVATLGQNRGAFSPGGKAHIVGLAGTALYFGSIVAGTTMHNARIIRISFDSPFAHLGQFLTGFGLFGFPTI